MSKIARYSGNLAAFGSNATLNKRTVFGDENTHSDTLTDNINADFYTGWETLGPNPIPPIQYMTGAMFGMTQLSAYTHQVGVPEYDNAQEYHIGSITNSGGQLYRSLTDDNVGNLPTDKTHWHLITGDTGDKPYAVFTDFGAVGDGVTDCTTAWNTVIADVSLPVLVIPQGDFNFTTQPNVIDRPITIIGENASLSKLIQSYIPAGQYNGLVKIANHTGDVNIENLNIEVANNMTSPATIEAVSLPSDATSNVNVSRVKIRRAGAGSISHCLSIDGTANATNINNVTIRNCDFESQSDSAVKLEKVNNATVEGVFDSATTYAIEVDGSAATDNTNINITSTELDKLSIKQCTNVTVRVPHIDTITTDATANKVQVFGDVSILAGNWTDSIIFGSGTFDSVKAIPGYQNLPGGLVMQWVEVNLTNPSSGVVHGSAALAKSFTTLIGVIGSVTISDTSPSGIDSSSAVVSSTTTTVSASAHQQYNKTIRVLVLGT